MTYIIRKHKKYFPFTKTVYVITLGFSVHSALRFQLSTHHLWIPSILTFTQMFVLQEIISKFMERKSPVRRFHYITLYHFR